jgi:hypothetical protein
VIGEPSTRKPGPGPGSHFLTFEGGRRRIILDRLRRWTPFSNSSPVEGITHAIRTYSAPDKKISLYVLGDEFTGKSIDGVIETVDRINKKDREGNRLVRALMRLLCEQNGGAFVGLNSTRPKGERLLLVVRDLGFPRARPSERTALPDEILRREPSSLRSQLLDTLESSMTYRFRRADATCIRAFPVPPRHRSSALRSLRAPPARSRDNQVSPLRGTY